MITLSCSSIESDRSKLHKQIRTLLILIKLLLLFLGASCSSVVKAFAHGAMGRRIDLSWGEPIELFLVPASAPRPVTKAVVCAIMSVGWCI